MRTPIYRVRFYRGRHGTAWNGYCQPGYSPLTFPGIAGANTLAECLDRIAKHIAIAQNKARK